MKSVWSSIREDLGATASIRQRLLLYLLLPLVLLMCLVPVLGYRHAQHELDEVFDAALARTSRLLFAALEEPLQRGDSSTIARITSRYIAYHDHFERVPGDEDIKARLRELFNGDEGEEAHEGGHIYERGLAINVTDDQGRMLFQSSDAPHIDQKTFLAPGFHDICIKEDKWRVFVLVDERSKFRIIVAQHEVLRAELSRENAIILVAPFVVSIPLFVVIILFGVARGLRPVKGVVAELQARDADNLEQMSVALTPRELVPMIEAMNHLFARLESAIVRERQFTSDAAHELRTPLAALRVQAEVALAAKQSDERERALRQIVMGVDRSTHLVEQLLMLARLDAVSMKRREAAIDIKSCLAELISRRILLALDKQQELALQSSASFKIIGDPLLLTQLFENLLSNAIKYSPSGAMIHFEIDAEQRAVYLRDTGPGIDDALIDKIFDRFYRVDEDRSKGSGLGLSIVQRIADLYHWDIRITNRNQGGLQVRVQFNS